MEIAAAQVCNFLPEFLFATTTFSNIFAFTAFSTAAGGLTSWLSSTAVVSVTLNTYHLLW